jgi:hypothetical protein
MNETVPVKDVGEHIFASPPFRAELRTDGLTDRQTDGLTPFVNAADRPIQSTVGFLQSFVIVIICHNRL